MNYEKAVKELCQIVEKVWGKIDSGFYPELEEFLKLLAILSLEEPKKKFWNLFNFLFEDLLLVVSKQDFSEEIEKTLEIIKNINEQKEVVAEAIFLTERYLDRVTKKTTRKNYFVEA